LLHHFGGGGDLGAADRAKGRLRQAVISLLRRIGLGDRGRPQFIGQIAIGQAATRASHIHRAIASTRSLIFTAGELIAFV
jgi:hypothetical protein